jgi:hypothetical protein
MRHPVHSLVSAAAACLLLVTIALLGSRIDAQQIDLSTNTPVNFVASSTFTLTPTLTHTPTPTLTPTSTPTPSPTPTQVGPFNYPEGFNPLTGMPYTSQEARDRRTFMIKISNFPLIVRPQSGVNAADLVYEYEVEGGVTRFAAFFRENAPTVVGPVRSGRLVDVELVQMYEALFGYSGASDPVTALIRSQPWFPRVISPARGDNCAEAGFCWVDGDLPREHRLYVNMQQAWERATARGGEVNQGRRARGFSFSDQVDPATPRVNDIFVDYFGRSNARWQYDPDSGRYLRFSDGMAHFDAAENAQLWADNVVIIEVEHVNRPDLFEPESRAASHQINLWGSGRAYIFRDGHWLPGLWRRECRGTEPDPEFPPGREDPCWSRAGDALQLLALDGVTPNPLKPGRTWVMITRWLNYVTLSDQYADMPATMTALPPTPSR